MALFSKDSQDQKLISPEILEHQMRWKPGTGTMANYMGHNVSVLNGSFFDSIAKIRNEQIDKKTGQDRVPNYIQKLAKSDEFEEFVETFKQYETNEFSDYPTSTSSSSDTE